MPPQLVYWIKFEAEPVPKKFKFMHMDEMWYALREMMMRDPQRYGLIEWMIRDY